MVYQKKPQQYTLYKKGRAKEYAAIKDLKEEGFNLCQRSPGSRGPVDVWAVNTKEKKILLVQVKSSLPQSAINKIMLDSGLLNGDFKVEFEVWQKDYIGKEFERTRLEGDLLEKFKLSESERLEFDRIKKKKAKRLEKRKAKKEKILAEQREKDWELQQKKYKRKQARELKLEKQREEELRLEFEKEKEKKLKPLKIEEERIINLPIFQIHNEPGNLYLPLETSNSVLIGMKEDLLRKIKWDIDSLEGSKFYPKESYIDAV